MKKFIIDVRGPSCAGKSTLVEKFVKERKGTMYINPDKIKWFFTDYLDNKSKYRRILGTMVLSITKDALENGISVIFEGRESMDTELLNQIAENNNADLHTVNVTADYNVLLERFRERIKSVKVAGKVIGNMKEEGLKTRYENHIENKRPGLELDSSSMSEEKMLEELVKYITKG